MAPKIQHKRSAVAGKAPLPADLEYGEIAVNYEATDPALYIKDSADAVRKIGNQPAATETVAGIVELATAAETTTGTDATRTVHPAGLRVELDKKATKTVTSDTAPANPADGDLWYDSVGGELYVWYDSDDAGAVAGTWVRANPQPTPKQATASVAGVDVKLWKKTGTLLEPETAGDKVADATLTGTTCKAWVNFSGIGTVAIRKAYNVNSITDNGVGEYTVNFATALSDTNYCAVVTPMAGAPGSSIVEHVSGTVSTFSMRVSFNRSAGDYDKIYAAIFD